MESSDVEGDAQGSAPRRQSGRVRRKPTAFEPSLASKRKRGEPDELDDGAGDDDDDEEDSEGEPDEEEVREKRQSRRKSGGARKPASKKAKPNGSGEHAGLAIRTTGGQRARKPAKKRAVQDATAVQAGGIYADVFARDTPLDDASAEWIARFKAHEAKGISEVFNFVLKCAGCDSKVDEHDAEDPDHFPEKLRDIQEEYQAQNVTEYPIIGKSKAASSFRHTMDAMFNSLIVNLAASSLLYERPEIMENIESWVGTMSSAGNRPFRHTATAVSLAVVTALCEIGKELINNSAQTLRMSESEKKKSRMNKARVKELDGKVKEGAARRERLDSDITSWFETVFVHRYRDVDPRIRLDCVQALTNWMVIYPDFFFDTQYLRYLGWVLSDTAAGTRLEVVKQLQKLYSDKDKMGGLKTFTERFRARIVEMATRDSDSNVRAVAVELLDTLRELGLLEPNDIDSVGRLIFDSEPRVRKAVVPFFSENVKDLYESKIEELGGQEATEDLARDDEDGAYDTPSLEWLSLKALVETLQSYDAEEQSLPSQVERWPGGAGYSLIASGIESRFSVAAQSLYDQLPEVQDWEALAGYLLFDHSRSRRMQNGAASNVEALLKDSCRLDEKEEAILLEILNAAVKREFSAAVEANADKKAKKSRQERELVMEEQEQAARRLANLIPRLLKKFGAQPEAASAVLRLEHVLNLDVFQELRQDSTTFAALLDDINKQFLTHGSESVLAEASAALLHAKRFDDLGEVTEGKLQTLWQDTTAALHTLTRGKDTRTRGSLGHNTLSGVTNTVLRLANLASITDCVEIFEATPAPPSASRSKKRQSQKGSETRDAPVIDVLIDLLQRGPPTTDITPEADLLEDAIVSHAGKATLFYCLWKVKSLKESISANTEIRYEEVEALAEREDNLIAQLTRILTKRKGPDDLRFAAAGHLLDVHCAFATLRQARRRNQGMQQADDWVALCLEVDPQTQGVLRELLGTAERAFAKKSKKHLEDGVEDGDEPLSDDEPEDDEEDEGDVDDEDEAKRDEKMEATLVAEQRLCELASKIVMGILAGVVDGKDVPRRDGERPDAPGPMRRRLGRNKARLGPNYKQVIEFLELEKRQGGKSARSRHPTAQKSSEAAKQAKRLPVARSNEFIDADEDEEMADDPDAEDAEALRARGLLVEDDIEDDEIAENGAAEVESVLGD